MAIKTRKLSVSVHTLDLLLHGLKSNASSDIEYRQELTDLENVIQTYIDTAQRTAQDKIEMDSIKLILV
ncbi:nuclear pore complex protein Nup160 homolog [Anastrepha obliqua]|uniref:nuclear pore complex protein Nup160 homolog n=1 Tax=Anastrepha obliqua TaxID=95512 RepID=UPI0024099DA4|nr:nuclear pore complex protein Nup160 homolog [Anastrepha obliqua]